MVSVEGPLLWGGVSDSPANGKLLSRSQVSGEEPSLKGTEHQGS